MSDCVCIWNDDGDLPEFSTEAVVKARKPYACCECRGIIAIGQQHERVSGKWDGDIRTYRTCLLCREIRRAFCCDVWTFTLLWDDIEEQMFRERGLDGACLENLSTVDAKQFLQRRWWAWVESCQAHPARILKSEGSQATGSASDRSSS